LKTFWHDTKIVQDDLEVHSFEDMETVPAMDVNLAQEEHVQLVIQEMKAFKSFFLESLLDGDNDIFQFWLRKSKKPVLAVLLVSGKDGKPLLYRGTNMEVSMPTGSLCAERNVIGTALASNPGLKREDLRMVAVLAVPLDTERPSNMRRSSSLASYSSIQEEETGWVLPTKETTEAIHAAAAGVEGKPTEVAEVPMYHAVSSNPPSFVDLTPRSTPPGTPVRRITLYSQGQETQLHQKSKPVMGLGRAKPRRTVLVPSAEVRLGDDVLVGPMVRTTYSPLFHPLFDSKIMLGFESTSSLRCVQ
jgi:hypothetical protein